MDASFLGVGGDNAIGPADAALAAGQLAQTQITGDLLAKVASTTDVYLAKTKALPVPCNPSQRNKKNKIRSKSESFLQQLL